LAALAGVDPADDAWFEGAVRPIDAVDVWPMVLGTNTTHPRAYTPTSEYSIVQNQYKLVTLGGQSNYYTVNATHINPPQYNLPCLEGCQPHHAGEDNPVTGCVVCNITHPCLFDLHKDPQESNNVALENPSIVQLLNNTLASYTPYGDFTMNSTQLAPYTAIPASYWHGYAGPCYGKGTVLVFDQIVPLEDARLLAWMKRRYVQSNTAPLGLSYPSQLDDASIRAIQYCTSRVVVSLTVG
jgi:hypothetical protein